MEALRSLFQNKILQRIITNSFWLSISQGINGLVNLFLAIFIVRALGPSEYGKFAYVFSFITLFSAFFDFGLTVTVIKEFAGDQKQEKYFQDILLLKSIIGLLTILLILAISFFIMKDPTLRFIAVILAIYRFFFEALNLVYAFFRARQKMQFETGIRFFQTGGLFCVAVLVIYYGGSIVNLAYSYAISTTIAFFLALFFLISREKIFSRFQFRWRNPVYKKYLLMGWYIALAQGVTDIMVNTDSFLLGYWGLLSGVGLYNAASKINAVVLFPMGLITTALLPVLIQTLKKSELQFIQFWTHWMRGTLFFVIFISFFVFYQAETIIKLFYGPEYLAAATVLKIMIIMAVIVYINNLHFQIILIFNQQRNIFYSYSCGCIVNVLLNLLWIPHWGITGAAAATVGGQLIGGAIVVWIVAKHTIIRPFNREFIHTLIIAMTAGALMLVSLSFIKQTGFLISFCLSGLIYSLAFLILNKSYLWCLNLKYVMRGIFNE